MFVSDCIGINEKGHLTIGGNDTTELARKYGTPLYVYDEQEIRKNCRFFVNSIRENYDGNGLVIYASKAFSCKAMCRICAEEGMGLDVVSGGEIYTALQAGFPVDKIYFHGNNKTYEELELAVEHDIGRIVVDNVYELEMLNEIACRLGKRADILFRIKPGIDAHTHDFIRTGQIDSKFGIDIQTGEAMEAVEKALSMQGVCLKGVHCHIGSQIFDIAPFEFAAEVMAGFMGAVKKKIGFEFDELDLGGGFGIKYKEKDNPKPYSEYMKNVSSALKAACEKNGIKTPFVIIEPGRSIAGAAGITLYTVGTVKTIPDVRTYVSVDGGMTDNPRYILYQAAYEAVIANKADKPRDFTATIAGKCCESGDLIQEHTPIQKPEPGDILAVLSTGAYNYSMASNYNRIPRPAAVLVNGDKSDIIVKRETYEDLVRNDV